MFNLQWFIGNNPTINWEPSVNHKIVSKYYTMNADIIHKNQKRKGKEHTIPLAVTELLKRGQMFKGIWW
jgi:hypothetical protein